MGHAPTTRSPSIFAARQRPSMTGDEVRRTPVNMRTTQLPGRRRYPTKSCLILACCDCASDTYRQSTPCQNRMYFRRRRSFDYPSAGSCRRHYNWSLPLGRSERRHRRSKHFPPGTHFHRRRNFGYPSARWCKCRRSSFLPPGSSKRKYRRRTGESVLLIAADSRVETREIAAISRDFKSNAGTFLCSADCVAEREGFEPSIQVLARITV
jgi:hypothetical protein